MDKFCRTRQLGGSFFLVSEASKKFTNHRAILIHEDFLFVVSAAGGNYNNACQLVLHASVCAPEADVEA